MMIYKINRTYVVIDRGERVRQRSMDRATPRHWALRNVAQSTVYKKIIVKNVIYFRCRQNF